MKRFVRPPGVEPGSEPYKSSWIDRIHEQIELKVGLEPTIMSLYKGGAIPLGDISELYDKQ